MPLFQVLLENVKIVQRLFRIVLHAILPVLIHTALIVTQQLYRYLSAKIENHAQNVKIYSPIALTVANGRLELFAPNANKGFTLQMMDKAALNAKKLFRIVKNVQKLTMGRQFVFPAKGCISLIFLI